MKKNNENRIKRSLLIFITFLIMLSCHSSNRYYIVSKRADGLKIGSEIRSGGSSIGDISDITFINNRVLLEITLDKKTKLSVHSKLTLETSDFFTNVIEIDNINMPPFIKIGDTLITDIERHSIPIEKIDSMSLQLLDSIKSKLNNIPPTNR